MKPLYLILAFALPSMLTFKVQAQQFEALCQGQRVVASSPSVFGPKCRNIRQISGPVQTPRPPVVAPAPRPPVVAPAPKPPVLAPYAASCPSSMGIPDNRALCQTFNMKTKKWGPPHSTPSCPRGGSLRGAMCIR
jgi:hypothetical protein